MDFLTKLRENFSSFYLEHYDVCVTDIEAEYPDKNWNVWTWSNILLLDFELFVHKSNKFTDFYKALALRFGRKSLDKNSYHYDFSRKIFLFKKLQNERNKIGILIPECGPCGFEILIALMSGYKKIVAYDIDPVLIKCAKRLYADFNIDFIESSSNSFDFEKYKNQCPTIIVPDWGHDDIGKKAKIFDNSICYTDSKSFLSHKKYITLTDLRDFRKKISSL